MQGRIRDVTYGLPAPPRTVWPPEHDKAVERDGSHDDRNGPYPVTDDDDEYRPQVFRELAHTASLLRNPQSFFILT